MTRDAYGQEVVLKVPLQYAWGFMREDVFPDGASFPHPVRELTRAGWAAVSMDRDGNVLAKISGPVHRPLPQTRRQQSLLPWLEWRPTCTMRPRCTQTAWG